MMGLLEEFLWERIVTSAGKVTPLESLSPPHPHTMPAPVCVQLFLETATLPHESCRKVSEHWIPEAAPIRRSQSTYDHGFCCCYGVTLFFFVRDDIVVPVSLCYFSLCKSKLTLRL